MSNQTIDAILLKKMFLAGAANLEAKKEWINELNVFPVPDGDTGTNMTMTIMSAASEVSALENPTMETLSKAISSGSLRGARGNSGVILSQLCRGFTKEIKKLDEINSVAIAAACERAVETAYKAVMKPKEGTILTVAKGVSLKVSELANKTDDLEEIIEGAIAYGDEVLNKTPDMLPVLKQAGVVDSGGQGLMQVLKGARDAFLGKELDLSAVSGGAKKTESSVSVENIDTADIKFGYCTEFIVMLEVPYSKKIENDFKSYLESIGDSIVCVADDEIIKIHVHTNDPGLAIQKGLTYGSLTKMKIDNMREEHNERLIKNASNESANATESANAPKEEVVTTPPKEYGFISVSVGEGINEIFRSLGVDYIIEGGQTMNPSTADILDAVEKVNAKTVYVLPNNKNIILAAQQAEKLSKDKKVVVVPTKTIPQGISAIIGFDSSLSSEDALAQMTEEIGNVKTGQVTYAVRDTSIDGIEIKEGNIMGIADKGIVACGEKVDDTTLEMIETMVDEDSELISLFYGSDVTEEEAEELGAKIEEAYPDCEVEINKGDQPIYYYIISVE